MKKKSNAIIYVLLACITLCLVFGTVGLMTSKMNKQEEKQDEKEEKKEYTVAYKYYLDGTEVKEEIKKEEVEVASEEFEGVTEKKNLYSFKEYKCTNNVEGTWDEEKWEFTPNLNANTTCRLYFVKNFHNVTITAINGTLDNNAKEKVKTVELDKTGAVKVIPTSGYKFTNVECTNNAKGEFKEDSNELILSEVTKDSLCTITFGIKSYKASVKISNGSVEGEDNKSANYGENITFSINPSEGYSNPTVACDNGQSGSISGNTLTINGISNDTVCTVQYKLAKFNVTLKVNNGSVVGAETQQTASGKVVFGIDKNDGYQYTGADLKCDVASTKIDLTSSIVTITSVTSDVNCEVTLKAEDTSGE